MNKDSLVERHEDENFPSVEVLIEYINANKPMRYLLLPVFEKLMIYKYCLEQLKQLYQSDDVSITSENCELCPTIMHIVMDAYPEFSAIKMVPFLKIIAQADSFDVYGDLQCHVHITLAFQDCYKQINLD